ncbi:MAG: DegT/DnrJ/EryC1/StrS family aminotransferase [Lentisphaerae bacterium]|jgi:dTDP-4-amino-4,6-dideoxygalactose transaminase|nr:DegT/DnrJ/EryC1/StrS family aminotransferase [Lentisphaerota bacterium]MBT5607047.1 DegT/DnrJ/EryC1/StrS family aminotransferase [Lentisphaerota bacterium]MBT7055801.1 DegT/DnrJ/EryC1/StrS family aminotransferase [Lentisphaerota bacterium]
MADQTVPFLDLVAQHAPIRDDILSAWTQILDSCGFVGGQHVEGFEQAFAQACECRHAVTVSSGTDALLLALKALGVGPGDEVILPANTFLATAEAVSHAGATPVFADVVHGTWNIDSEKISELVTPRTRGVIGVHLYGQPFDVDAVQSVCDRHGIWLMEDSAQGHLAEYKGRRTGGLARIAAFSFYPGKNLGAPGEGGAVTTNDSALAEHVRKLRDHGQREKYVHELVGFNCRLPSLMAAALGIKLPHLSAWNAARRRNAALYKKQLQNAPGILLPTELDCCTGVYHLFVVHVDRRDQVFEQLKKAGVGVGIHYKRPCHLQPCYSDLGHGPGAFPVAEYNASHCLSLPMYAELSEDQVEYVCERLVEAVRS